MIKVATGGKQSQVVRKMKMTLRAADAPGKSCDPGDDSGPQLVNLRMVDDDGDVLIDSAKTVLCVAGMQQKISRSVLFRGPLHCANSDVPSGVSSTGVITATGSATGSPDYVESHTVRCNH